MCLSDGGESKKFRVYFCPGSVLTQKEGSRNLGKQTEKNQVFWWLELPVSAGAEGSWHDPGLRSHLEV